MEYNIKIEQKKIKKPNVDALIKMINISCKFNQREWAGRGKEGEKTSKGSISGRIKETILQTIKPHDSGVANPMCSASVRYGSWPAWASITKAALLSPALPGE